MTFTMQHRYKNNITVNSHQSYMLPPSDLGLPWQSLSYDLRQVVGISKLMRHWGS